MSTGEYTNERPFSDDYPDARTPEQRAQDQRAACRQAGALVRQQREGFWEREVLQSLQRRRAGKADSVQFDVVKDRNAAGTKHTLIVRGELLADQSVVGGEGTRRMLETFGLRWEPIECLEGRVGRLINPDIDANRLIDIARLLRRSGHLASVNHITPLGPIMKAGHGGAEPSVAHVDFPPAFTKKSDRPTVVAVIDTGIAQQRRSDGWLDAVARGGNIDPLDAFPGPDGFLDFGAGHGTFAAGVVQQVAPGAELRVYQAIDSDGIGSEVHVACEMIRAVQEGAQILNLSLGVQTIDDQPPLAIAAALQVISESGKGDVLVIAAAGNDGSTRPCWPAAFRSVVSVAALTAELTQTEWSNRGFWVDCSTVGEGVLSTYPEGMESPEIDPEPDTFAADAWAVWSGTSFAAPQIAGAVARLADERQITPRDALRELLRAGRRIPDYGVAIRILPGT